MNRKTKERILAFVFWVSFALSIVGIISTIVMTYLSFATADSLLGGAAAATTFFTLGFMLAAALSADQL